MSVTPIYDAMCEAVSAVHRMSDEEIEREAGLADASPEERLAFWQRLASPEPERALIAIRLRSEDYAACLFAMRGGNVRRLNKRRLLMLLEMSRKERLQ